MSLIPSVLPTETKVETKTESKIERVKKRTAEQITHDPKFQIMSDIHLEHRTSFPDIVVAGDILCLLGDIGDPKSEVYWMFLKNMSEQFFTILLLTGNHEYYGAEIGKTNAFIEHKIDEMKLNNVIFMNNKVFKIGNHVCIGTTLWSRIPPSAKTEIEGRINDYRLIKGFTTDISNDLHTKNVKWLETILEKYKNDEKTKVIVLSHHSPLLKNTSFHLYENKPTNHAFSSDLSSLMKYVDYWCMGHTHHNHPKNEWTYGKRTKIASNQMGYSMSLCSNFNPKYCLAI